MLMSHHSIDSCLILYICKVDNKTALNVVCSFILFNADVINYIYFNNKSRHIPAVTDIPAASCPPEQPHGWRCWWALPSSASYPARGLMIHPSARDKQRGN